MKFTEHWKSIRGFMRLYKVSNLGNIISLRTGRLLKPYLRGDGYPSVGLCKDRKRTRLSVHYLVADAFIGIRPKKMQVDHIDADKTNNKLSNLRYLTCRQNIARKFDIPGRFIGSTKAGNKWSAAASVNGSRVYIGIYDTPLLASRAYKKFIKSLDTPQEKK